jgi:chromosomal replication initiator protein
MSETPGVESSSFSVGDAQDIWERAIDALHGRLNPQIYAAYIQVLRFIAFENEEFVVGAPSRLVCIQVENKFKSEITAILAQELNLPALKIRFVVSPSAQQTSSSSPTSSSSVSATPASSLRVVAAEGAGTPAIGNSKIGSSLKIGAVLGSIGISRSQVQSSVGPSTIVRKIATQNQPAWSPGSSFATSRVLINSRYTFETYVVGSSNQFCHAAAMRVAEEPARNYNPLFIYGGVGLGKTHLLHAIANTVLARQPAAKVLYLSSETFTNELIQALRIGKMDTFKSLLRNIDVLLIDDIQFMCGKERTQEEFFHTFNALYNAKKQIVITSDQLPQDIPGLEERLQTRFSWGLTADLHAPDFETRVAILKKKALQERVSVPENVLHFIAEKISSNVRELEGALTRLQAASSLRGAPITLEFATASLKPLFAPKVVNITVDDIKRAVADQFSIKVSDMVSKRRTKNLSFPRHIAMYLSRKHTTLSYPEIGTNFGNRDHSSVIHASNVVASKIAIDEEVRALVGLIERRIVG